MRRFRVSRSAWWTGKRSAIAALALTLGVCARPAWAVDDAARSAARRLATAGVEAFQQENYSVAVDKLERAYQMLKVPSIGLWLARTLAKQGKLVAASERYTEIGRMPVDSGDVSVQRNAQRDAAVEFEALTPRIPSIVVRVEGAEVSAVTLQLDGKELPSAVIGEQQPVDPGKHRIEGRRGDDLVSSDVTVAEGESRTAVLIFSASNNTTTKRAPETARSEPAISDRAPTASGSGRRVLAWSVIGVGAAGLVTGAVAGGLAIGKKGDLDDSGECVDRVCYRPATQSDLDSYGTLRTVSTVGFIAGGVLAATGVVLLLTSPRPEPSSKQAALWLGVGAGTVTAGGRF